LGVVEGVIEVLLSRRREVAEGRLVYGYRRVGSMVVAEDTVVGTQ